MEPKTNHTQPKTISYSRTRKVNPALIHPRYQYGIEEFSFTAWADIPEDADIQSETENLKVYVDDIIAEQINALIDDLRRKANARTFSWNAVAMAFADLMLSQNMSEEQINVGISKLRELAEKHQAAETV